jgi:hypothetical protein
MHRRDLLLGLGAGAILGGAAGFRAGKLRKLQAARFNWRPATLQPSPARQNDASVYFTDQRLSEALGAPTLAEPDCSVVAYSFPAWHPSPFMERALGRGWTEFDLLRKSHPLYPGQLLPKYPLWGYFNEADPAWAEKEIDTAADYGIDAWMIDWYWHSGTMFYHEQLENGFLRARNSHRLKFAVMWANHDWRNVYPAPSTGEAPMLLPQAHSEADCVRAIEYCIEHYFHAPNYWRLDNALVFGIFDVDRLARSLTVDGMRRTFDKMRDRVRRAGLGELHIQSSHVHGHLEGDFRQLGINSATHYHTFGGLIGTPGGVVPYGDGALKSIEQWKQLSERADVPVFPDCPVGWDDSARSGGSSQMVTERSPDQFERLMRGARHFVSAQKHRVVFLSSWNEWTEDHFLLPDTFFGYSYLEAVRRAFREGSRTS